jgi:hypothetical protein
MPVRFEEDKDPGDRLDWNLDFTNLLEAAEIITSVSWTIPTGLTNENTEIVANAAGTAGKVARVWLSGGTTATTYTLTAAATTDTGSPVRIIERDAILVVRNI